MPTAPDLTPTQPESVNPVQDVNIPVPLDAFGGAVAHAVEGLGTSLDQAGNKVWDRAIAFQNLQNQTEANKADAAFMEQSAPIHQAFSALRGEEASKGLPDYIQKLTQLRDNLRGGLSNPMVQKMFDSTSLGTLGRTIFNGAGHAGEQTTQANIESAQTRLDALLKNGSTGTDADVEATMRQAAPLIAQLNHAKGIPDATSTQIDEVNSSLKANQLSFSALKDPMGSYDALEKAHNDKIVSDDDYKAAKTKITALRNTYISDNLATDTLASMTDKDGNPVKTYEQAQKEVLDKASKAVTDEANFPKLALASFKQQYTNQQSAKRYDDYQSKQSLDEVIMANPGITMQQLSTNPATATIVGNMQPAARMALADSLTAKNTKATVDTSKYERERLEGMATDPSDAVRAQFMDQNFRDNPKLLQGDINKLVERRGKILKNPTDEPHTIRAMQWLRSTMPEQLRAAGVYARPTTDDKQTPDDYDHFVGVLNAAIEQWQVDTGNPASQKDIEKTIAPALLKTHVEGRFFHSDVEAYKGILPTDSHGVVKVPDDFAAEARTATYQKYGVANLSDEVIHQMYVRKALATLYPTPKKAPPNE